MSQWQFRSTFCRVGVGLGRAPDRWADAIASPTTDFSEDPSAVLILFNSGAQCSLLVEPIGGQFALSWEIRKAEPRLHLAVVPHVVPGEMALFDRTHNDDPVPRGSLVDRSTASRLVRHFLETPDELPEVVDWVSRFDLQWPED